MGIKKYMEKEGKDCTTIDRAIAIMVTVPKNADDMMNVGRLQGFEGRITAQGRLLLQGTLLVHEPNENDHNSHNDHFSSSSKNKKKHSHQQQNHAPEPIKLKERRVFLFQQIII